MPNLAPHATLATDSGFRGRLQAALAQRAIVASDEAKPDTTATDAQKRRWAERVTFARQVLRNPAGYVERFAWLVAGDSTVLAALAADPAKGNPTLLPDAPVEAAVDALWQLQVRATRTDELIVTTTP